jgi:hypothetical protein
MPAAINSSDWSLSHRPQESSVSATLPASRQTNSAKCLCCDADKLTDTMRPGTHCVQGDARSNDLRARPPCSHANVVVLSIETATARQKERYRTASAHACHASIEIANISASLHRRGLQCWRRKTRIIVMEACAADSLPPMSPC